MSKSPLHITQAKPLESEWFLQNAYPHKDQLRCWIRKRYPSIPSPEEIVQETFVRIIKVNRVRPVEEPKPYLFSIARNLCVDALRRDNIVSFRPLTPVDEEQMPVSSPSTQEILIEKEHFQILTDAIRSLPKKCRQVVTLRKVYGLSAKQIAQKLGLSSRTVENQLLIGVKKCREYYQKLENELHAETRDPKQ
ncbi:RNA polymerase sigma factor [Pelagicoccus albus]|uniref:Sigma-70 family RNA polymerase sigma factor n=1 Tax=Pelagicoccus albus TaxID=415222 RepID=A0A7X1E8C2_9BACT|nr:sigma-70 family RNA polymerase sigma factor [Pelagicoccus albus]MBC2606111.1 sigma-70 family RNA polymerase sigma factor [Pelagicoccus albus]